MRIARLALLAAVLCAACNREPDFEPVEQSAPQDHIPQPAPTDEVLSELKPDTLAPAVAPDTTAPAVPMPGAAAPSNDAPSTPSSPSQTPAQQSAGEAMLLRASEAYANVRSMKADFVMHFNNPLLRQQTTSRGALYQRRPDRIALRFTDPAGDVLLSDGQSFWVYYPSIDAKQVIRCAAAASGDQGVDLQAQFVGDPVRRFRFTHHGQEPVAGRPAEVLTLEPRERAEYRTLKVWLDTRDALARRFEITEHNGSVRRFDLSNFEVNPSIPDATFRFSPPEGAQIVSCG